MPGSLPPYALDLTSFPFPALAALAGRAPLGGAREAALAGLLLARLAASAADPPAPGGWRGTPLDPVLQRERAALGRQWLSGLSLPSSARSALNRAIEATAQGATASLRPALDAAVAALSPFLDPASRAELQQLVSAAGT